MINSSKKCPFDIKLSTEIDNHIKICYKQSLNSYMYIKKQEIRDKKKKSTVL